MYSSTSVPEYGIPITLSLIHIYTEFEFDNFNEVMDYFKKMINICKQMNYSKFKSEEYNKFHKQLQELVEERKA